jgi:hypothetical protein
MDRLDFREWLSNNEYLIRPFSPSPNGVRTSINRQSVERNQFGVTEIHAHGAICHWCCSDVLAEHSLRLKGESLEILSPGGELSSVGVFLDYAAHFYEFIHYAGPLFITVSISHASGDVSRTLGLCRVNISEPATMISASRKIDLRASVSARDLVNDSLPTVRELADHLYRHFGIWQADCINDKGLFRAQ